MYKITNKAKDTRKFRDSYTGKNIVLGSKKSAIVVKPIDGGSIFKVEKIEEKEVNNKEVKQNDSSSN